VVESQPNVRWTYVRNPNYWNAGKPYLDEIEVTTGGDIQSSIVALESGALDVIYPPVRDAVRLATDAKYKVISAPWTASSYVLCFNTNIAPLNDKRVRQAINFALDRKRWTETTLLKTSSPTVLPWSPDSPAYEPAKNSAYDFDLDKARSLLRAAGVSNLNFDYITIASLPEYNDLGSILQADLAKIGITIAQKPTEPPVFVSLYSPRPTYNGLMSGNIGFVQLEPSSTLATSAYFTPGPAINQSEFKSERYTQMVNAVVVETDAAKRKAMYSELNDFIIDEAWALSIAPIRATIATSSKVQDLKLRPNQAPLFADAWLSA
jgi:peptide/nickel transport system substrate-binding protein